MSMYLYLPPKQVPKANAQMRGCKGNETRSARRVTILIIMVVKGILSMKADAIPETQRIRRMATVSLDSLSTLAMISSV